MKTFKMKIFTDFIAEARKERRFVTKAEAQAKFDKLPPEEQEIRVLRNAGQKHGGWGTKMKYSLKKQQKKRFETLKPLKKDDFVQAARRDLSIKNTEVQNVAKKAYDLEKATKRAQRKEAQLKSKETGKQHDVDHITAQPNRRRADLQSRWKKVIPGDASANREVIPQSQNLRKNSKNDPNRKKLTRAGAIQTIMRQVRENQTMNVGNTGYQSGGSASQQGGYDPFMFPRDSDLLDQGFQAPGETGQDRWNRFFGVVPVARITLKSKLDGEGSIDDMVAASQEYTKVQDDLTDKERHQKIKRWAFGIRN